MALRESPRGLIAQTMTLPYKVLVDDNFHYMDESERHEHGNFATLEEAMRACASIVEQSLEESYQPGMTAGELLERYVSFGDDPFIVAPPGAVEGVPFSARDYAHRRAEEICAERSGEPGA